MILQTHAKQLQYVNRSITMSEQIILPENTITRAEAKNAFHEMRKQTADIPEMYIFREYSLSVPVCISKGV